MSTVNFNSDNSVQGTITTITSTPLGINLYAYNTSLSKLSSYSYLSINNLNTTSTTSFNNLNSLSTNSILSINGHTTQISNLNATSTTIFNNLNSLSTNSTLSINNLNATSTTTFNNLNSFSTNSRLLINNLNNTSTTIFNNLNSLSTNSTLSINNLNATSITIFNNLNSLSTNSIFSINSINATSTTIFNNLNSLSTNSILNINNLNATSTTIFANLTTSNSVFATSINNLRATSTTIFNNLNSLSSNSTLNINNLNATSTTTFNNLNSFSTNSILNINNLNTTSTSIFNKTNFTNLLVSNASTINSSLNIVGNIIGSGTALTNLNYNSILNPPSLVSFNNPSTFISSLNISGNTNLNNVTTINSSLNVSGYTTLSGGTITGKVLMNGTIVNDHSLQIRTDNYTAPLLQIDAGVRRSVALNSNPRAIGKVFLGLGGRAATGVGDYYAIGLGYLYNPTDPYCCEIGVVITNFSGAECGDLVFSLRNTTGQYDVATERMRIKSDGTITINNNTTLFSALNVSGLTTFSNNVNMKSTNPALTIMGQGGTGATSTLNLFTFDNASNAGSCSIIATDMGSYGNTFKINLKTSGGTITTGQFTALFIDNTGNISCCSNLSTAGNISCTGTLTATTFSGNGASLTSIPYSALTGVPTNYVLKSGDTMTGSLTTSGSITANSGTSQFTNAIYINNPFGRTTHFPYVGNNENYIRGKLNIDQDDLYVGGATTISGRTYCNGGLNILVNNWVNDTNGNNRIHFGSGGRTYYQGYGQYTTDTNHEWWNHQSTAIMKLFNTGSLQLTGEIIPTMYSVSNSGTDYCGVTINTAINTAYTTSIKIMYGTFTGFHRCFTDDIEFKEEEPQKFKDDYVGRIVVSTGKIATDSKNENDNEWSILYDKEGISIEDALPIIQLSRTKKDKRVFGVLGMPTRQNSRAERMIVNSVGEGGIWVCNSNGNIENGDYITSSDYLGYGEKQDDDLLHNYTVAKATIDCNFDLDSSYYNCLELDNNIKIAFIACTYHCG